MSRVYSIRPPQRDATGLQIQGWAPSSLPFASRGEIGYTQTHNMTQLPTLPLSAARLMLLSAQGLLTPPAQRAVKADVLIAIRRIGALQIDTIHVVARAPYFILFSRIGAYDPAWLDQHLAERRLFEYWSHAACFLPIEDFPLYVHRMQRDTQRYYSPEWGEQHSDVIQAVLQRIHSAGEVRSADFERTDGRKGSWWDWKIEKQALEYLHTVGELMIARRENFQRVYDLRERILPGFDMASAFPVEKAQDELATRSVRALGLAPAHWVPDYFRLPKQGMGARLERLAGQGRLLRAAVEGWKEPAYLHPENLPLLEQAARGELRATVSTLLSPFDPLVSDRTRARELFDFDYTIECYLPQPKRRYGYFTLPILHRGTLAGRLDAKAHRNGSAGKPGVFEVKSLYLEPKASASEELAAGIAATLQRCAGWHGTPCVQVRMTDPASFAAMLEEHLDSPRSRKDR